MIKKRFGFNLQMETPKQLPEERRDRLLLDVSNMTGSPRLKAFEGRSWVWSDRTGYSYGMSPTYRCQWTPDRDTKLTTPMPNMARWPIPYYNDGEVSFGKSILSNSARRRLQFGDESTTTNLHHSVSLG